MSLAASSAMGVSRRSEAGAELASAGRGGAGRAVLVIDDEDTLARNLALYLGRLGYEVQTAGSAEEGLARHADFRPDIVLLDHNLPGMSGLQAIEPLRQLDPQAQIVLITGFGGSEVALEAMRRGAVDHLAKPLALSELRLRLDRLQLLDRLQGAAQYYRQRTAAEGGLGGLGGLDGLLGRSPDIVDLRQRLSRLAECERGLPASRLPTVLLRGENGSGKALAARALHLAGTRAAMSFIAFDCARLPVERLAGELFGCESGVDGQAGRRVGRVEAAEGGTLLLERVDEAPVSLRADLRTLIEQRRFRRVGALRDRQADVRIIASTHLPQHPGWTAGPSTMPEGRPYRVVLDVPPLRARGDDVVLLARHFLALNGRRYRRADLRLSGEAEAALLAHAWPGNVRELRNAMEQAVLLCRGSIVGVRELASMVARP